MVIGRQEFKLLVMVSTRRKWSLYRFSILARSLTFMLSDSEKWQASTTLLILQLDENNFHAKSCSNGTENCTTVHKEVQYFIIF
jgi:hypothetical protein